jgi:hypothetical protein
LSNGFEKNGSIFELKGNEKGVVWRQKEGNENVRKNSARP